MIIATIGHQEYELASMADAEAILNIFNRANPVDRTFRPDRDSYYVADKNHTSITIEINSRQLVTQEQHEAFVAEDKAKKTLKEVA